VVRALVEAGSVEARRRLPGLDDKRADIILGGAVILEQVMGELEITTMVVSDYALREGVLLDARERAGGASIHQLHDLRRRGVLHLAELMDDDPEHSARTARLALEVFDTAAPWLGLRDDARELLEAAALLANVGQFVSHDKHHKHSYYVIRNTDHLQGYTDHEIELIALIARYHRKSAPKDSHPEFAALRSADQHLVRGCAGILRIAIGLDRTHAGLVEHVRVARGKKDEGALARPMVIEVIGRPDADLSLELYTAEERKDLLASVLGAPVTVVDATP
jgi:exopolyphosphatase/guanosine-5'-triphosphate,3'-diphosphate pyrophosphatase